jgi:MFS family permease
MTEDDHPRDRRTSTIEIIPGRLQSNSSLY